MTEVFGVQVPGIVQIDERTMRDIQAGGAIVGGIVVIVFATMAMLDNHDII